MDPTLLILDVKEKETSEPKAPSFPQLKSTTTTTTSSGFPEHKKRAKRTSAFKQKQQQTKGFLSDEEKARAVFLGSSGAALTSKPPNKTTRDDVSQKTTVTTASENGDNDASETNPKTDEHDAELQQRRLIDRENNERLASMSPQEIEAARQDLFGGLDPSILEMLLKRANLDEAGPAPFPSSSSDNALDPSAQDPPEIRITDTSFTTPRQEEETREDLEGTEHIPNPKKPSKSVHFAPSVTEEIEQTKPTGRELPTSLPADDDGNDTTNNDNTAVATTPADPRPHWPRPPAQPDLDLNDPNFLEALHAKYFPSLPADPSKLAWMAPIPTPNSPADYDSPYHPSHRSLPMSALRFEFRGLLIPPRIARAVSVRRGLHHHGEAPEAAGYTIPELARLARSAVPGQRCISYQTLGRILFRLGRGEFGTVGDHAGIADGIWRQVVEGKMLDSVGEEAAADEHRAHRSARAFAIEALWLFEKGGWKERLRRGK